MNKLLLICFLLFSCVSTDNHRGSSRKPTPEQRATVAQEIQIKESPIHISKDSPAWKPFIFITLFIILGCFLSARHKYINKAWNKICSKLDKDK
tara:strand:+ start:5600 stop:5881 length:282 start_codon:yes stop_codon:yes gene_type:complete